jgi:NitT/TauT family transport system substrate-binding protein
LNSSSDNAAGGAQGECQQHARDDPDKGFRWFFYADHGIDLYSNGVRVSAKLAQEKPEAVINRALHEAVGDPQKAIELLASEEPLRNEIELRRLTYAYGSLIDTPEAREVGIGAVNDERLKSSIAIVSSAFELAKQPDSAQVFDSTFLPPKADRLPCAIQR